MNVRALLEKKGLQCKIKLDLIVRKACRTGFTFLFYAQLIKRQILQRVWRFFFYDATYHSTFKSCLVRNIQNIIRAFYRRSNRSRRQIIQWFYRTLVRLCLLYKNFYSKLWGPTEDKNQVSSLPRPSGSFIQDVPCSLFILVVVNHLKTFYWLGARACGITLSGAVQQSRDILVMVRMG